MHLSGVNTIGDTAATNLLRNGGVETNANGCAAAGGGTATATRTASTGIYGGFVLRAVCTNDSANQGALYGLWTTDTSPAVTAGSVYSASVDIQKVSGSGTVNIRIGWYKSDNTFISSTDSAEFAVPTARTRVSVSGTAPALAAKALLIVNRASGSTGVVTFDLDGAQIEAGSTATPYIETDGGTASRTASNQQRPLHSIHVR